MHLKFLHHTKNQFKAFQCSQKKVKKESILPKFIFISVCFNSFFILNSLKNNILYFKSPTQIKLSQDINIDKKIRIGGMVKKDSLEINNQEIKFIVTDFKNEVIVSYSGTVPNLFSEGKRCCSRGKVKR